jgi:predicted amidohydrolase YtcJ
MKMINHLYCGLLVAACLACRARQPVDLIVHNASIYTVDSVFSKLQAMAVKDGRILALGSEKDILRSYRSGHQLDAGGRYIFPGFIDAHAHFIAYGSSLFRVDLTGSASWAEVLQRVRAFTAAHPGSGWILGQGWDQNRFPGKDFPVNDSLNRQYPDRPVLLSRIDGHAAIANALALELSGVRAGRKLSGGMIGTAGGRLTGLLVDNAVGLVEAHVPAPSPADLRRWLLAAQANCFAQGLTTITDCGLMYDAVALIDSLQKAGDLKMKLCVLLSMIRLTITAT